MDISGLIFGVKYHKTKFLIRIWERENKIVTEERFEKCILAMKKGNKEGLKEVYEEYGSYIYGIVRQLLSVKEEAEDITSEFFIRLWEKAGSYRAGSGHKGWMATIARNMAIDLLRKRRREELVDFHTERAEDAQTEEYGQRAAGRRDILEAAGSGQESVEDAVVSEMSMKEALLTLKEAEREVIHMKIMGEMTFQEISDILQVPLGTVTWRYREAIKKLRRCGYEESGRGI